MAKANLILANIWLFGAVVFYGLTLSFTEQSSNSNAPVNQDNPGLIESGKIVETADAVVPVMPLSPAVKKADGGLELRTNQSGVDLIKEREGLRLESYYGPAGTLLIGYGHAAGVTPEMKINETEAESLLRDDLQAIEQHIRNELHVEVSENEFSAMVVLAYNIGTGAFANSTVMLELNAGNRSAAADGFLMWNKVNRNGQFIEDPHLTEHRAKERNLFLS